MVVASGRDPGTRRSSRVMVTGATGFIGSQVALQARRERRAVIGVYWSGSQPQALRSELLSRAGVELRSAELDSATGLLREMTAFRPDAVIHAAGSTNRDPAGWDQAVAANVLSVSVLIAAIANLPERERPVVVVPGSQAEYGDLPMPWTEDRGGRPNSAYGASKLAATELLLAARRAGSLRGSVVRLPLVFGPLQGFTMFIPQLIAAAIAGHRFQMTHGEQRRRVIYVEDAANVLLAVADLAQASDHPALLNAPASEPIRLVELASRTMRLMADPIELQVGSLPSRPDEQLDAWPDSSLAESLGLTCQTDLDAALRATIDWYRGTLSSASTSPERRIGVS